VDKGKTIISIKVLMMGKGVVELTWNRGARQQRQSATRTSWRQNPGLSKKISVYKVKGSSAKLLAMVDMVGWTGIWKSTKGNSFVCLDNYPWHNTNFMEKIKGKKQ
jgi:hypothetical protein